MALFFEALMHLLISECVKRIIETKDGEDKGKTTIPSVVWKQLLDARESFESDGYCHLDILLLTLVMSQFRIFFIPICQDAL